MYDGLGADFYDHYTPGMPGDVRFYVEEAQKAGSPILELACGTGRATIPIAQAGVDIVGVDLSENMLSIARDKIATLSQETQSRIQLVEGDMRSFYLDEGHGKFKMAMIPYRSFCHLMTPEDQRRALERIRGHLADDGLLIINLFDPKLNWLIKDEDFPETPLRKHLEFIHPQTGNRVVIWNTRKHDMDNQIIDEDRIFEEIDGNGVVVSKSYVKLALRFTYRYEMQYLLELNGYKVEALYGSFLRGSFRYGGEQIWIARKIS